MVVMAAYAPLFVNVNPGGMRWSSNLIGYDALNSWFAELLCAGDVARAWEVPH